MRDIEVIDSELRLLVAIRRTVREAGCRRRHGSMSCWTSARPGRSGSGGTGLWNVGERDCEL
jgi:hypothetical protein